MGPNALSRKPVQKLGSGQRERVGMPKTGERLSSAGVALSSCKHLQSYSRIKCVLIRKNTLLWLPLECQGKMRTCPQLVCVDSLLVFGELAALLPG